MIVKFAVRGAWHLFDEVDSLEYAYVGREGTVLSEDTIDYREEVDRPISEEEWAKMPRVVSLLMMNKNQLEPSHIITYGPVYLMNNEGRTIETI